MFGGARPGRLSYSQRSGVLDCRQREHGNSRSHDSFRRRHSRHDRRTLCRFLGGWSPLSVPLSSVVGAGLLSLTSLRADMPRSYRRSVCGPANRSRLGIVLLASEKCRGDWVKRWGVGGEWRLSIDLIRFRCYPHTNSPIDSTYKMTVDDEDNQRTYDLGFSLPSVPR